MRRTCAIFFSAILGAGAQQVGQNSPTGPKDIPTFSTSAQLVVEIVNANDKSGKPVEGLTAKDFTITEDGKPQTIAFFEYQKLPDGPAPPEPARTEQITVFDRLAKTQIAVEPPGGIRYRDRRLLALYFDMTA